MTVSGETKAEERSSAISKLTSGEVKFIFCVVYITKGRYSRNKHHTFLRPTESLTIFLQQLGRGLRHSKGKEYLTVLDYVGQSHRNYDFESKLKALMGRTKHSVEYCNKRILSLPRGCYIHLEKQAKEYILRNIRS